MQEIPECLSRRYKALDELVRELGTSESRPNADCSTGDPSIRLLCDFWDILKEDPDVNLSQAVQQRMCANPGRCTLFGTHNVSCYMAGCCKKNDDKKQDNINKSKSTRKPSKESSEKNVSCETQSMAPNNRVDELPLNKVLCDLKQAASFEKKCQNKVNDLLETQARLQEQIQVLEQREKDGIQLLKQADCMWSCMEETYKKKIGESLERQKDLLKQLREVEASNMKWRKNKKDLEFEIDHVNKCQHEITEKINQKTNDIKCIDMEIEDFKKRIENNKKDLDVAKNSFGTKKQASAARTINIQAEVTRLEKVLKEEQQHKKSKEEEADKYVKEARQDLQKLCKVLLQKKLESEDMKAEKEALLLEIDLLRQNSDQCKDKCKNKQESINEEIKKIDKEIAEFKVKCIRCHECTDTLDIRRFCTDCPRCVNDRDCLYVGDHCCPDNNLDCVCTTVKHKLLDNVFDNMYTVLERQVKSGAGKAVADVVLNCLKKSRNGKLNAETRKILQDFILTTIKKNLNLTIVGGAVKTRCEMDRNTYKQLMLCLKQVKVTKPAKVDRGTESKKDPCRRWGGASECNCPKGPKDCICTKKALPPPNEPAACPPKTEDEEDAGQVVLCPYKESAACGPDCAMHELPDAVGSEVASWRPNPCQGPTCQFKNMRAAQCVLGQDGLSTFSSPKILRNEDPSKSGHSSTDPHVSYKDLRCHPRDRIIEEVLGRYTEVAPIEKVSYTMISSDSIDIKSQNYTKQLKAVKNKINDKDNGKMVVESVGKGPQLKAMPNDEEDLTDNNPIMLKSFSGDILKIALHKTMVDEINKNIQEGTNVFVTLKTEFGQPVFSLQSDATIANDQNIFLPKKSKSGNITLEAHKSIRKRSFDDVYSKESLNKLHEELKNNEIEKVTKDDSSYPNKSSLKKYHVNNIKEHKKDYNSNGTKIDEIHEVKFKGVNNCKDKEIIFAIKETSSDNFKIVLDKEFEIYQKQAIKEYEGDNSVQFAEFLKTNSGHCIINFRENSDDDKNKALLIKTESGNIKVLVGKSKTDNLVNKKDSMSNCIMSANDLDKLLNISQSISKKCSTQHSKLPKLPVIIKSFSDSNLYKKEKSDFPDQNKQISHKDFSGGINLECKANATSCGGQCQDNLCDKSKCVCKNICYKSKQWRWETSNHKNINNQYDISSVKLKENSSNSLKPSKLMGEKSELSDAELKFLKKPLEPPNNIRNKEQPGTESCGCSFTMEKMTKENYNNAIDDTCSYTRNKYMSTSNERLDTDNYIKACNKNKRQEFKKICNETEHSWDTLEYFPPQLPPFLRDFNFP
ncbi:uncharacterized protein LOC126772293 [Nymphalis io]|uniref:uncharacterized protein LOC126772293 n=1 Tax=Inachis io TaxID=171585 RepID=UPI002169B61F|nr:uncharacterized protein LOC126772293 [Nymphalis io]